MPTILTIESEDTEDWRSLIAEAIKAAKYAYAPYSNYKVGVALLTNNGKIYRGCNVENAAYRPSICAEQTAIVKAISEGDKQFRAMAVATKNRVTPCGVCRQVIREFAPTLPIIITDMDGNAQILNLTDLLPHSFGPENLE